MAGAFAQPLQELVVLALQLDDAHLAPDGSLIEARQLPGACFQVFERSSQRLFALAQALLRQLPLSHVSCSPKPLDDVALRIEQWNRVRERPTPATIQAAHAMLELKDALGSHRLLD